MDELDQCYHVLGLPPGAAPDRVEQAYRDLLVVWQPERYSYDARLQQTAREKLKEIHGAYESLKANFFAAGVPAPVESPGVPDQPAPADDTRAVPPEPESGGLLVPIGLLALVLVGVAAWWVAARRPSHPATDTAASPASAQFAECGAPGPPRVPISLAGLRRAELRGYPAHRLAHRHVYGRMLGISPRRPGLRYPGQFPGAGGIRLRHEIRRRQHPWRHRGRDALAYRDGRRAAAL